MTHMTRKRQTKQSIEKLRKLNSLYPELMAGPGEDALIYAIQILTFVERSKPIVANTARTNSKDIGEKLTSLAVAQKETIAKLLNSKHLHAESPI